MVAREISELLQTEDYSPKPQVLKACLSSYKLRVPDILAGSYQKKWESSMSYRVVKHAFQV